MTRESDTGSQDPDFHLVLQPHRSLSPLGFWILMGAVCVVSFVAGMYFFVTGAWPVVGFLGLDVLAIYWAFRASYRSGRLVETLELNRDKLTVRRITPAGRLHQWEFQPYWLRVELDEPVEHGSQIRLSSHGRSLIIGAFLPPSERKEVAEVLRDALARQRAPITP